MGETPRDRISADRLVPPALQARLQQVGNQGDLAEYEIGDIGNELAHEYKHLMKKWIDPEGVEHEPALTMGALWSAIGQFCGRSPHTVRDYMFVSKNVKPRLRRKYHMLGRTVQKTLIGVSQGDQKKHEEMCEKVLALADDERFNGTIPPVSVVRDWMYKQDGAPPEWHRWVNVARSTCEKLAKSEEAPAGTKRGATQFLADVPKVRVERNQSPSSNQS
jgi:hypothetical protein